MSADPFAAYFSHSWRPRDVDLNLEIWNRIGNACDLLVDVPADPAADPPYYINRIEELLRRSDIFVSVLTAREAPDPEAPPDSDDAMRCSPYALFEIRLAERFSLPRLVIYERATGFRSPDRIGDDETYLPFDRAPDESLPERPQLQHEMRPKIEGWLGWVLGHLRPRGHQSRTLALIVPPLDPAAAAEATPVLERTLRLTGHDPLVLQPGRAPNAHVFRLLCRAGLVVLEIGATADSATLQVAAAAHARGIPTIRTLRRSTPGPVSQDELPWMLRGHPGGYQQDVVVWNSAGELAPLVEPRARAMFNVVRALSADDVARHFQAKRYAAYSVFVSHNLKPPRRALVEEIFEQLARRQVKCFEYRVVNPAGIPWREELAKELEATTHFVILLGEGYELSEPCTYELEAVLARGNAVTILPYLLDGRTSAHVKLSGLHHQPLESSDPRASASAVVDRVLTLLRAAVG